MVVVPPDTPVITPVVELIKAMPDAALDQVPPDVTSVSVEELPWQSVRVPEIGDGAGLTVTTVEVLQPVEPKTKMIVVVPELTPVTTPVVDPTVATDVLLLDQVPVPDASTNVVEVPAQSAVVPDIDAGNALTVTTAVALQPPAE